MGEAIVYCDRCGKMIYPNAREKDGSVVDSNGSLCASCAGPRAEAKVKAPAGGGRKASHRSRISRKGSGAGQKPVLVASAAAGVIALVVTIALVSGSGSRREPRVVDARPMSDVPASVARASVAADTSIWSAPEDEKQTDSPTQSEKALAKDASDVSPPSAIAETAPVEKPSVAARPEDEMIQTPGPAPQPIGPRVVVTQTAPQGIASEETPPAADTGAAALERLDVNKGLVGHWRFDETDGTRAADSSPAGNHGTLSGSPQWRPDAGRIGGALSFDGGGDCVVVGDSPSLSMKTAFTLAAWGKVSDWGARVPNLFSKDSNGTFRWRLAMFEETMKEPMVWLLVNDGGNFEAPARPCPATKGKWHHFAGTVDLSKRTICFYLDGKLLGQNTVTKERLYDGAGPLVLGASDNGGGEGWLGLLDDMRVYDRALTSDEIALIASPARLSCSALLGTFDAEKTSPKKIAAVGGAVAADALFNASLGAALGSEYAFAGRLGLAGKGKTIRAALKGLSGRLAREKPEVVRVCFDATLLARGRSVDQLKTGLAELAAVITGGGAVPVLYTLPTERPEDEQARASVDEYNTMVRDVSFETGALLVDAYRILNQDDAATRDYFARGRLQASGYEALNDEFLATYRLIERVVMGRDVEVPLLRVAETVAVARDDAAPPMAIEAPLPTVAGAVSLLPNGGFEETDAESRFASMWQPFPVGAQGSARIDHSNPHGGENALVIRASAARPESGTYTTLSLQPGEYVLRYWACADIEATARVAVHVAGEERGVDEVGEEWQQFTHSVKIEQKQLNTSVRICSVTASVRVWLDDVDLLPRPASSR